MLRALANHWKQPGRARRRSDGVWLFATGGVEQNALLIANLLLQPEFPLMRLWHVELPGGLFLVPSSRRAAMRIADFLSSLYRALWRNRPITPDRFGKFQGCKKSRER